MKYTKPEIEIVVFETADVLANSCDGLCDYTQPDEGNAYVKAQEIGK